MAKRILNSVLLDSQINVNKVDCAYWTTNRLWIHWFSKNRLKKI